MLIRVVAESSGGRRRRRGRLISHEPVPCGCCESDHESERARSMAEAQGRSRPRALHRFDRSTVAAFAYIRIIFVTCICRILAASGLYE
ncbi:hypothetical protein EVAR_2420_1 [Eumeta japonica]|uniref:Uncharacterized protein n=1 Tax=Eumeta variegata TaxID=151549 RepID=A0A4C1SN79_EUMVA|nr:hypothetical protein EVAR_2420_1 [Eumeta japonica]